jgi:signal peptidase I
MIEIKQFLIQRGWIDIPANGTSMYPLIKEGNVCRFTPLDPAEPLKKGDIILYLSDHGQLIGHRYSHHYVEGDSRCYIFKGDTNALPDPPVKETQLIGKLTSIKKGIFRLNQTGVLARFWGAVCFALPMIPKYCVWIRGKERYHA